ncbi:hypothetical protein ACYPKM_01390 [Pseudomonas aeruginosa]
MSKHSHGSEPLSFQAWKDKNKDSILASCRKEFGNQVQEYQDHIEDLYEKYTSRQKRWGRSHDNALAM